MEPYSYEFPIESREDGFNYFICNSLSAHVHWDYDPEENKVFIDGVQYGRYEMSIDAGTKTISGNKVGQSAKWEKTSLLRSSSDEKATRGMISHDHNHCDHKMRAT